MKKLILSLICFVVLLGSVLGQDADAFGTGFFITGNGVIITCAHVIESANRIVIKTDGREYTAEVLSRNNDLDLAVLKINYNNPCHFKITDFNTVNLGDRLSVLGFPLPDILSSDIRFTEGSLSSRSGLKSDPIYFQHSAPTQPGNSGGPVLNARFEVVGVVAAIIDDSAVRNATGLSPQNINFGIKSGYIDSLLNNIRPGNGNIRSLPDAERATVQILCYFSRAADSSVRVVNNTGYTGYYLYIRPAGTGNLGSDRLGSSILENRQSFTVSSLPVSAGNRYDIRLVDEDDDTYTKLNVLIGPNQSIVFTFDDFDRGSSTQASQSNDGPPITIVNNTGYLVYFLYISPTTSDVWGEDRLASDQTLANGQSVSVNLPHPLNVTDRYDIMLEDLDGDTYSKYNVTVTANSRIVFTFDDIDID